MTDVVELAFSRPETTTAVTRGAATLTVALGFAPLLEVILPNGRRADIMALSPRGRIAIVEVKSGLDDFRTDFKWGDYLPFCDLFYFAVAPEFPMGVLPPEPGLIVADAFDGAVIREPPDSPLAPARRKALTLAFARLAALRSIALPLRSGGSTGEAGEGGMPLHPYGVTLPRKRGRI